MAEAPLKFWGALLLLTVGVALSILGGAYAMEPPCEDGVEVNVRHYGAAERLDTSTAMEFYDLSIDGQLVFLNALDAARGSTNTDYLVRDVPSEFSFPMLVRYDGRYYFVRRMGRHVCKPPLELALLPGLAMIAAGIFLFRRFETA